VLDDVEDDEDEEDDEDDVMSTFGKDDDMAGDGGELPKP